MSRRAPRADIFNATCPSRNVLELIGGKWSMLILCALRTGPERTLSLKRRIDGVSQKMLTQTLRELQRHGLIERIDSGRSRRAWNTGLPASDSHSVC